MEKEKKGIYKFLRILCIILLKILYQPKVIGKENIPSEGAIIFAGNHIHAFDPTLVISNTNRIVHFMAKEELFKGFHGKVFKRMGLIKVNRSKINPGAVLEAERILKESGTIGIFPEGTRNKTNDELLRFKHGAVAIAKKANTPIIPFVIKGKYRLFGKKLIIEFGKKIEVYNMETNEANDYLKNEILNLLRK